MGGPGGRESDVRECISKGSPSIRATCACSVNPELHCCFSNSSFACFFQCSMAVSISKELHSFSPSFLPDPHQWAAAGPPCNASSPLARVPALRWLCLAPGEGAEAGCADPSRLRWLFPADQPQGARPPWKHFGDLLLSRIESFRENVRQRDCWEDPFPI